MTITTWWRRRHGRAYEAGRADGLEEALAAVSGARDHLDARRRILQIIESDETTRRRTS